KELSAIRDAVGVKKVERSDAEAELFGADAELETTRAENKKGFDEFATGSIKALKAADPIAHIDQKMIDQGLALNAAIVLADPTKLLETSQEIKKISEDKKLGLQVTDWQTAAGIVGQFII